MDQRFIPLIFFFYGLAFFSMGLAILLENAHASDRRLRHALRPLAAFGFIHGLNEWMEMFEMLNMLHLNRQYLMLWEALRLMILAFSFLSLGAFGSSLLSQDERQRRYSLLVPLGLAAIWGLGLFFLRGVYPPLEMLAVTDVWTRYVLAIPGGLAACAGLIAQQRRFRQTGLARFGRDTLWAAVAFFWYGIIGQIFTRETALPPSHLINQNLFIDLFGFPVQLLRAAAAISAAVFVMRFLRAFEVENERQLRELQEARLREAEQREQMRAELFRRVVEAQEAERQRIARELHDETGQALTALGLGLRGVGTALNQDAEKAAHHLRQLEGLTSASLDELQRLIADLRPSHLDDLGLAATLRWYSADVQNRAPLKVQVEINGDERPLSSPVKTALFRITQEALNNTIKHAGAKHAWVYLKYAADGVNLIVIDDGRGFNPRRPAKDRHWGLEGMRERASLLGGTCLIDATPGRGTRVEVTIPYSAPALEDVEHADAIVVG